MSFVAPGRQDRWYFRRQTPALYAAGFSMIELLAVIAIILIMFTLYFKGSNSDAHRTQLAACEKNLEQIYVALKTFASDNNEKYPVVPGAQTSEAPLSLLVPRYTSVTEIFICPASGDRKLPEAASFERRKISYAYCMGRTTADGADVVLMSDAQINTLPKSAGRPLFSRDGKGPGRNHGANGGNLLFGDGQVRSSAPKADAAVTLPPGVVLLNPKPS